MPIGNAYSGKVDFEIFDVKFEPDSNADFGAPPNLNFEYARPSIGIDNKGRFITHEIVGGTTVRQKIGEEPREMSVTGIIQSDEKAKKLDKLRDAKSAKVTSNRIPGETMKCQIPSVSTSPISDGGGVAIENGEFLYNFKMKLVELTSTEDTQKSESSDSSGSSEEEQDSDNDGVSDENDDTRGVVSTETDRERSLGDENVVLFEGEKLIMTEVVAKRVARGDDEDEIVSDLSRRDISESRINDAIDAMSDDLSNVEKVSRLDVKLGLSGTQIRRVLGLLGLDPGEIDLALTEAFSGQ